MQVQIKDADNIYVHWKLWYSQILHKLNLWIFVRNYRQRIAHGRTIDQQNHNVNFPILNINKNEQKIQKKVMYNALYIALSFTMSLVY